MTTRRFIREMPGVPVSRSPISNASVSASTGHISRQRAVHDDACRRGSPRHESERAFDQVCLIACDAGYLHDGIINRDLTFTGLDHLPEGNTRHGTLFGNRPAPTIDQTAKRPKNAKVELQAIAMTDV